MSTPPPASICVLRLSALGDATHALALVRALQAAWPTTRITWVVGKLEARLVGDVASVEFIVVDKKRGWRALGDVRAALRGRRFDVLLQCQVALRANLLSSQIRAARRIGYDRARSKDLHGWFINERIAARSGMHVLDTLLSFLGPLGLTPAAPRWGLPIAEQDHAFAAQHLPGEQPTLIISPCSSHALRNWHAQGYAALAEHAVRRHNLRVALCGGPSAIEREMGDAIRRAANVELVDLIGKDTLKQFLALAQRARVVVSPDSGPMHMANAVGTPVLGLHAASNPQRSGPYHWRDYCVDRYDAAARRYKGRPAAELPWGTKIEYPGVMDLIEADAVCAALDRLLAAP
jgi:heptosyltransferase I